MIITYANVFLFVLMSKKSVITLFEKSLSSPKSIPFRVEAPIISPYKFLIMNLLYNVLFRECHRITSRRLYFGVCILLPLFCLFFMATIFGNGQMENIPIGIVDQDNTAASRTIARRIAATPTFRVTEHFTDEASARQALQRKEIYGYLSIPPQFEQKTVSGTGATLTYYYHYALLSVGSELMAAFETTLAPVALSPIVVQAEALGVGQEQIQTFLLPVEANTHPLYNPDMDYSIYLSQPFFFVLFQILILLVTVYTIGSEFKFGTTQEWMGAATPAGKDPANLRNADMLTAVAGKLLPYTVMFSVIGILANYVLFGLMNIPFQGSLWLMNIVTVLFIMATQALAVLIFSIFPKIAYIISVVSMVGSLGATLSGVTFPVTAMYAPVHAASYLFPVRHFTEAAQAMIYFGAGFAYFWQSVAVLLVFLLLAILILPLLKWWILRRKESEETLHIGDKALSGIAATDIQSGISSGTSPGTEQCHPPRMESHCHQSRHPAGAGRGNLPLWLTLQLYVCSQSGTQSTGCRSRPLPLRTQPGVRTMAGCRPADFGLCPNAQYPRSPQVDEKRRGYRYTLHPFRLRDACSARRDFRIHPVCRHGRIPQLQGIARSKLARDACRKRCPPACRNSIPAAARSVGRCVVHSRQRIGNGPLQLHRRIRFLPDSRRNDCHHLPDNADGDCHAYRRRSGTAAERHSQHESPFPERYAVHRIGKNLRICNAVCCVLHVPVGTAAAYFQHSQYRKRLGHCHYDDSFPACHEFLCACRVPLVYRLRSPTADDSLLFCGLHLPFRRVLPAGTDALVLASGALRLPCGPRSTRFRKIKFNGRQPCRHLASDADAVDTSNHIRCVGGVHYKESL